MADIVLGMGSSHSPMLSTPWEAFAGHADRDRGRVPEFEALARDKAAWIGRSSTRTSPGLATRRRRPPSAASATSSPTRLSTR